MQYDLLHKCFSFRSPAASNITLHQKALFTFWVSAICVWLVLQVVKLSGYLAGKKKHEEGYKNVASDDIEINSSVKGNFESILSNIEFSMKNKPLCTRLSCYVNLLKNVSRFFSNISLDRVDSSADKKSFLQNVVRKFKEICISHDKDQPSFERFLGKVALFGVFMLYFWLCDGLRVW